MRERSINPGFRCVVLTVLIVCGPGFSGQTFAQNAGGQTGPGLEDAGGGLSTSVQGTRPADRLEFGLSSTALGSVYISYAHRFDEGLELGARVEWPLILSIKSESFDSWRLAANVGGSVDMGGGFSLDFGGGPYIVTQSQSLGDLFTLGLTVSVGPVFEAAGWRFSVPVLADIGLLTTLNPSAYARASFDDRYETETESTSKASGLVFGGGALGLAVGAGIGYHFDESWAMELDMFYKIPAGLCGAMDGFSFGELPFALSLGISAGL